MQVRAKLRCRGLHLRQVHPEGEPVGIVEVHHPIPATGDYERIGAFLPEERIAFGTADQGIVPGAAADGIVAFAATAEVSPVAAVDGVGAILPE